jgi:hypothetical protein
MSPGEDLLSSEPTELAGTEPASGAGVVDVIAACQLWLALDFPDTSPNVLKETQ